MNLFYIAQLKLTAHNIGIKYIQANAATVVLEFNTHAKVDTQKLIDLIMNNPKEYKFASNKVTWYQQMDNTEQRLNKVTKLLKSITNN